MDDQGNYHNSASDVALLSSAKAGDLAAVHSALKNGANVNALQMDEYETITALHYAVRLGRQDIVEEILLWNAAEQVPQCPSIWQYAIMHPPEHVEDLLDTLMRAFDAKPWKTDRKGRTVLWWAASSGLVDLYDHLLNRWKESPPPTTDIMTADLDGTTPLLAAARAGHLPMLRSMVADQDEDYIQALLFDAAKGALTDGPEYDALSLILDAGLDVNAYNGNCTLLHHAAELGKFATEHLLESMRRPGPYNPRRPELMCNLRNSNGETPALVAARNGDEETVLYIAANFADLTYADINGNTILTWALKFRFWKLAERYFCAPGFDFLPVIQELTDEHLVWLSGICDHNDSTPIATCKQIFRSEVFLWLLRQKKSKVLPHWLKNGELSFVNRSQLMAGMYDRQADIPGILRPLDKIDRLLSESGDSGKYDWLTDVLEEREKLGGTMDNGW